MQFFLTVFRHSERKAVFPGDFPQESGRAGGIRLCPPPFGIGVDPLRVHHRNQPVIHRVTVRPVEEIHVAGPAGRHRLQSEPDRFEDGKPVPLRTVEREVDVAFPVEVVELLLLQKRVEQPDVRATAILLPLKLK